MGKVQARAAEDTVLIDGEIHGRCGFRAAGRTRTREAAGGRASKPLRRYLMESEDAVE
jgi:hypothetical protein